MIGVAQTSRNLVYFWGTDGNHWRYSFWDVLAITRLSYPGVMPDEVQALSCQVVLNTRISLRYVDDVAVFDPAPRSPFEIVVREIREQGYDLADGEAMRVADGEAMRVAGSDSPRASTRRADVGQN